MARRIQSGPLAGATFIAQPFTLGPRTTPRRGIDLTVVVRDAPSRGPQPQTNPELARRARALAPRDTALRVSVGERHGVFDMNNFRGHARRYHTVAVEHDVTANLAVGVQAERVEVGIHDYGSIRARGRRESDAVMVTARYTAGDANARVRPFVEAGAGIGRASTYVTSRGADFYPNDPRIAQVRVQGTSFAPAYEVGGGVSVQVAPGVEVDVHATWRQSLRDGVPVYLDLANGGTQRAVAASGGDLLQEGNFRMYTGGVRVRAAF